MIQAYIENVKPGQVLGRSLYSAGGDLLLAAGYLLDPKLIQRLRGLGYSAVWIQEEGTEQVIPEELINEQLALQTNKALRESAEIVKQVAQIKGETKEEIDRVIKDTDRFKNIIVVEKIKNVIDDILNNLLSQQDIMINVNSIRGKDDYLYQHNLDVTLMSVILANRLNLTRAEVMELAVGAILHDFGMVLIPDAIQKKGKRLTFQEFVILKEHTTYGYNILRENPRISPVSVHVAYQHHERQDGGGFPRGLKGNNELPSIKKLNLQPGCMHRYAEIVAVADAYDTLISPINHMDAKSPDEALRILIRGAGTQLNKFVVDALVTMTPSFPVGAFVSIIAGPKTLLGAKGVVVKNNPANLERPDILVLFNKDNRRVHPFTINTAAEQSIKIQFIMRN